MPVADLAIARHDLPPVAVLGVGVERLALIHLGHHLAGRRFLAPNEGESVRVINDSFQAEDVLRNRGYMAGREFTGHRSGGHRRTLPVLTIPHVSRDRHVQARVIKKTNNEIKL